MNQPYKEALQTLAADKAAFEAKLADLLTTEMQKFKNQTGINVESIYVNIDTIQSLGEPDRKILTGVSVDLDL